MGEEPAVGVTQANLLAGNLYDGSLKRTDEKKDIRKLLSPVVPTNIFCIGLNYSKVIQTSQIIRHMIVLFLYGLTGSEALRGKCRKAWRSAAN